MTINDTKEQIKVLKALNATQSLGLSESEHIALDFAITMLENIIR